MDSEPKPCEEESTESLLKHKNKNLHFREIYIALLQEQSEKYLQFKKTIETKTKINSNTRKT